MKKEYSHLSDFPILTKKFNGKRIIYLDNAATSQKPKEVINAIKEYYEEYNANIHRGVHKLAEIATERVEKSRKKIAKFINAQEKEIVFVRNATEGLNLLRYSLANVIKENDVILTTIMEHHSNYVPWLSLKDEKKCKLLAIDLTKNYLLNKEKLYEMIEKYKPKILTLTHCSNVLGTINEVDEICKFAKKHNSITIVDAAQSVPHMKIDVKKINCDFLVFSGHKMLAPTGIGILYGKKELLEEINPFMYGGDMIKEVHEQNFSTAEIPQKFEAGTLNIEGVIGLEKAVEYLEKIGMKKIFAHEKKLIKYCIEEFERNKLGTHYGPSLEYVDKNKKSGVFSFTLKSNVHPHDIAHYLDEKYNIAIRSGHHCAQPLHEYLGINATARASFYLYNTMEDVEVFIKGLKEVNKVFM